MEDIIEIFDALPRTTTISRTKPVNSNMPTVNRPQLNLDSLQVINKKVEKLGKEVTGITDMTASHFSMLDQKALDLKTDIERIEKTLKTHQQLINTCQLEIQALNKNNTKRVKQNDSMEKLQIKSIAECLASSNEYKDILNVLHQKATTWLAGQPDSVISAPGNKDHPLFILLSKEKLNKVTYGILKSVTSNPKDYGLNSSFATLLSSSKSNIFEAVQSTLADKLYHKLYNIKLSEAQIRGLDNCPGLNTLQRKRTLAVKK